MSHEVVAFLPKVDGEPALILMLYPGDAAHVEHHLTDLILTTKQTHLRTEESEREERQEGGRGGGDTGRQTDRKTDTDGHKPYCASFPERHQWSIQRCPDNTVPIERITLIYYNIYYIKDNTTQHKCLQK